MSEKVGPEHQFFMTEERIKDFMVKLAELGEKEGFTPSDFVIALGFAASWMADEIGLKIKSVEKMSVPIEGN